MSERRAKITFDLNMGLLSRGKVMFEIKSYCKDHNLELDVTEDKGLLSSSYHIIISGEYNAVALAKTALEAWLKDLIEKL